MNEYYSVANKLRQQKKITEEFEIMLNSLTFEEIFALRIELAMKTYHGRMYGFRLWTLVPNMVKLGLLKFAYKLPITRHEAASFLGVDVRDYTKLLEKHKVKEFFEKKT